MHCKMETVGAVCITSTLASSGPPLSYGEADQSVRKDSWVSPQRRLRCLILLVIVHPDLLLLLLAPPSNTSSVAWVAARLSAARPFPSSSSSSAPSRGLCDGAGDGCIGEWSSEEPVAPPPTARCATTSCPRPCWSASESWTRAWAYRRGATACSTTGW